MDPIHSPLSKDQSPPASRGLPSVTPLEGPQAKSKPPFMLIGGAIVLALLMVGAMMFMGPATDVGPVDPDETAGDVSGSPVDEFPGGESIPGEPEEKTVQDMNYPELVALNAPVECSVTLDMDGQPLTYTLSVLGSNARVDILDPAATYIKKGNDVYTSMNGAVGDMYAEAVPTLNCDWITADGEGDYPHIQVEQDFEAIEELPADAIDCSEVTFGSEKFDTPGKVCSHAEFEAALPPEEEE